MTDEGCSSQVLTMPTNSDLDPFYEISEVNTHTEWLPEEVSKLLELIKFHFGAVNSSIIKRPKDAVVFGKITDELSTGTGKIVTSRQVCQKWRNLQRSYYNYEESRISFNPGRKRKCEFHEEIGETLALLSFQKRPRRSHSAQLILPMRNSSFPRGPATEPEYSAWTPDEILQMVDIVNENRETLTDSVIEKEMAWNIVTEKLKKINPSIDSRSACKTWEDMVAAARRHKKALKRGEESRIPPFFDEVDGVLQRCTGEPGKTIFKKILPKDPILLLINLISKRYFRLIDARRAALAWQEIYTEIHKMFPYLTLDEVLKKWTSLKEDFIAYEQFRKLPTESQVIRKSPAYYEAMREILIDNETADFPSASYCQPISDGSWLPQDGIQKQQTPVTVVLSLNNQNENKPTLAVEDGPSNVASACVGESSSTRRFSEAESMMMNSLNRLCSLVEDMTKTRLDFDSQFLDQQRRQNSILEKLFELLNKAT